LEPRTVTIPYKPREHQRQIHDSVLRWNVLVCHRRFGKTVLAINHLIRDACQNELPRPRYAYLAPLLKQAKAIVWDYLKHYTRDIPGVTYNESELRCDLPNEARIQLLGADNPDAIRGIYLDGVVMDELAQMSPRVLTEIIRPALSDRRGWAIFMGTPYGKNHFYDLWSRYQEDPEWYCAMFKASQTGIVLPEELADARKMMTEGEYEQEYECSFSAGMLGSYYGTQMELADTEGRICDLPHDGNRQVHTWWDIGVNDTTAIWFVQRVGNWVHCIDYHEKSGEGVDYYAKVLREKPYVYGQHIGPHDLRVREWGANGATKRLEAARALGINFIVAPNIPRLDGIDATRRSLSRFKFDKTRCKVGIYALQAYHKEWDSDRKVYAKTPCHDWSSNAADAFRYGVTGWDMDAANRRSEAASEMAFNAFNYEHEKPPPQVITEFNAFTGE